MSVPVATLPASEAPAADGSRRPEPDRTVAVSVALARRELLRLSRSGGVLVTTALGIMLIFTASPFNDLRTDSIGMAFGFLPLAALTLVGAHRATSRPWRDGTEELLDALPAPPRARTGGHLLSVAGPFGIAAALLAATLFQRSQLVPSYGQIDWLEVLVGPVLVAGAGALGVLLARLSPRALVPIAGCIAIAVYEAQLVGERIVASGWRWMAFWIEEGTTEVQVGRRPGAHLVFLIGLTALAALAALIRHGLTRRLVVISLVTIGVTLAATVVQTRPAPRSEWAARNEAIANPSSVHQCRITGGVRYCMYPTQRGLVRVALAPRAERIRAALPATAWPDGIEVRQRVTPSDLQYAHGQAQRMAHLVPAMRAAITAQDPDDGNVYVARSWGWSPLQDAGFGLTLGGRVVGLPTGVGSDGAVCSAAGQARAAVALYAAGVSASRDATFVRRLAKTVTARAVDRAGLFVVSELNVYGGAAFGVEDAKLAVALLSQSTSAVRRGLTQHWTALTDPATSTAQAATLLGITGDFTPPAGPRVDVSTEAERVRVAGTCS